MEDSNGELSDVERYEIEIFRWSVASKPKIGRLVLSYAIAFMPSLLTIGILLTFESIWSSGPNVLTYVIVFALLLLMAASAVFLKSITPSGHEIVISTNTIKLTNNESCTILVRPDIVTALQFDSGLFIGTAVTGFHIPAPLLLSPLGTRLSKWQLDVRHRGGFNSQLTAFIGLPTCAFAGAIASTSTPTLRMLYGTFLLAMILWWTIDILRSPSQRALRFSAIFLYSTFSAVAISALKHL